MHTKLAYNVTIDRENVLAVDEERGMRTHASCNMGGKCWSFNFTPVNIYFFFRASNLFF
jgi:hypothetical protein